MDPSTRMGCRRSGPVFVSAPRGVPRRRVLVGLELVAEFPVEPPWKEVLPVVDVAQIEVVDDDIVRRIGTQLFEQPESIPP